jgi:hypothetical protein
MRRPWLILGLFINLACSNASFKGISGDRSRDDSAPPAQNEDATPNSPPAPAPGPIPIPPGPSSETPQTQNPGPVPCDPLGLTLWSLYHLNDDPCHENDTGDSGSDDDMDDDDSDEPGQNDPGQNDPTQNNY